MPEVMSSDRGRLTRIWRKSKEATDGIPMAGFTPPKRRRVGLACDRCRAMKHKCDGNQPLCARCRGYGYSCTWNGGRRRAWRDNGLSGGDSVVPAGQHEALRAYDSLVLSIREKVPEADRPDVDARLQYARTLAISDPSRPSTVSDQQQTPQETKVKDEPSIQTPPDQRYLGHASDVSFFNSIKRLIRASDETEKLDSYEIEESSVADIASHVAPDLPSREMSDRFIQVYFSSIHVAYPFICQQSFLQEYERFWASEQSADVSREWLATLFTIFAIGSYYAHVSSQEKSTSSVHDRYFSQALAISQHLRNERSRAHVCLLLIKCFYLLASGQTDKCWTTLGTAIRIAQSIGLHAEDDVPSLCSNRGVVEREMRRRAWHSLYVLDCLLSLQLGRPLAIVVSETTVNPPSKLDDMQFDLLLDRIPEATGDTHFADYFCSVIEFSHIVGHAVRDLFGPRREHNGRVQLCKIETIDRELLQWRSLLPRSLRFDLGHAFDKSSVRRKQRNMLAIKFFHLRALVHRQHLCALWLNPNGAMHMPTSDQDRHRIQASEMICVESAQETAHLMHNVPDKRTLTEDFPWWQIISCMMCASSILLVASKFSAFLELMDNSQRSALDEDINTLVTVFEALSVNSQAARLAREMTLGLQSASRQADPMQDESGSQAIATASDHIIPRSSNVSDSTLALPVPVPGQQSFVDPTGNTILSAEGMNELWQQGWPFELSDSLLWTSKFVDLNNVPDSVDPAGYSGA